MTETKIPEELDLQQHGFETQNLSQKIYFYDYQP
jgi:hypothetical protein